MFRLAVQKTATAIVAILVLVGCLGTYKYIPQSFNEALLGVCWMQLIFPLAGCLLAFSTGSSFNFLFAGGLLLYFAWSNYSNPNNGFMNAGKGSWFFQVPFMASLGLVLICSCYRPNSSGLLKLHSPTKSLQQLLSAASKIPVGLVIVWLSLLAMFLFVLHAFIFKQQGFVRVERVILLPAISLSLSFAYVAANLPPTLTAKRPYLMNVVRTLLVVAPICVFFLTRHSAGDVETRLEIVVPLCCGLLLLSPSIRSWTAGRTVGSELRQLSIADMFFTTTILALGTAGFLLLGRI